MKESNKISRRGFLGAAGAAAAGITIVPSNTIAGLGHKAPSDKLNIAAVGIGGMGFANLKNMETENIVALCDVDWNYSKNVFARYPNAKKYWDWRKMYDEMGKSFDAVLCATADHSHAVVTANAITMGKHVYTQKPLTHSVYESRLLTKLAKKYNIASQMGNQGSSGEGVNLTCEWIWNGEIGEIKKVEAFTDRPIWPQGLPDLPPEGPVPETFDWDLWLGIAGMRPYSEKYAPFAWRGFYDFGCGALGDMACHILGAPNVALKLGSPTSVECVMQEGKSK
jgi:predicted dehydrogenase